VKAEPVSEENRLYGDLAWLWPILADAAHYRHEAAAFRYAITGRPSLPTHQAPRELDYTTDLKSGDLLVHFFGGTSEGTGDPWPSSK